MSSKSFEIRVETVVAKDWVSDAWVADWAVVLVVDGTNARLVDTQTESFGPLWEPEQVARMVEALGRRLVEEHRAALAACRGPYSGGSPFL